LFGTYLSFTSTIMNQPLILLRFWGIFHGIFVGMLAAALTEVLNVFPILSKRIGVNHSLKWLLMAFVFGKITGSLFQWLVFEKTKRERLHEKKARYEKYFQFHPYKREIDERTFMDRRLL